MSYVPITTCRVDDARVPRVYCSSSGITSEDLLSGCNIVDSSTSQNDEMFSKRGRRSTIPVEIREETRRLKKQNMERRRRASISDKMKALHSLAMEVIGINPDESQKLEKVDLLNLCYTVFERVADIAEDKPELQARLRKLRHSLYEVTSSCPTRNAIPSSSSACCRSSSSSSSTLTSRLTSVTKKLDEFTESLHKVAIPAGNRKEDYASSSSVMNKPSEEEEEYSLMNTNSSSKITRILPSSFFQSNSTTTATNNTNTINISTATGNIPQSGQLVIDEDNKENKIPKLIIKNTFSNKSCSVVKTITTNTVTSTTPTPTATIPFSCMHNSSSMFTPLPSISSSSVLFVMYSTPPLPPPPFRESIMTNNSQQHSNTEIHSWNNNNNHWLTSTPLGGHWKHLDSTLNNSDSGFLSGNNSHSSGSIDNRRNQFDIVSDENTRLMGSTRPLNTPNVVHSLTDLLMNSTSPSFEKFEDEEEGVHHQQQQRFSAFGVPVKTTRDSLSSNPTSNYFHRQHDTMIFNRTKPPLTTTTSTNFVSCNSSHDTVKPTTTTTSPPIWRPYLD